MGSLRTGVKHADILTVSTLMHGQGAVDEVLGFLEKHTRHSGQGDISYAPAMGLADAYGAQITLYESANARFKVVRDDIGTYVYAWPHANGSRIEGEKTPAPRLR